MTLPNADTTEWTQILGAANSGVLQFDTKDIKAATDAAAQLIANLEALAQSVHDTRAHEVGAFSILQSSRDLAGVYSNHGAALYNSLMTHANVVRDQFDTFVAAGRPSRRTSTVRRSISTRWPSRRTSPAM